MGEELECKGNAKSGLEGFRGSDFECFSVVLHEVTNACRRLAEQSLLKRSGCSLKTDECRLVWATLAIFLS